MTYDLLARKRAKRKPYNLYFFRYGLEPDAYYAYTSSEIEVERVHEDIGRVVVYKPTPIMRSALVSSGSLDRATMTLTAARTIEVAELFRVYPPSDNVVLTIRGGDHANPDSDKPVTWMGRVLSCGRDNQSQAVFTCEPIATSLKRTGLKRGFQIGCNLLLYGPKCRADEMAATRDVEVESVEGNFVTLVEGWAGSDALRVKYIGGFGVWMNGLRKETRTVLNVIDDSVDFAGLPSGLGPGDVITLKLGCDHQKGTDGTEGDCFNLHNNIHNYGGSDWMPLESPMTSKSQY